MLAPNSRINGQILGLICHSQQSNGCSQFEAGLNLFGLDYLPKSYDSLKGTAMEY